MYLATTNAQQPNCNEGWSLQVVLLQPGRRATLLLAIDGLFCLSASAVLFLGSLYGVQRYGKHTQPYPGVC